MPTWLPYVLIAAAALVFGIVGFILGASHRKRVAEKTIGSAEDEAKRIVSQAISEGEQKKKEAVLEAKDEIHRRRSELEREVRDRRQELSKQEKRLVQKEETIDKKTDALDKKDEALTKKHKAADKKLEEVEEIRQQQLARLEEIAGYSTEEAKAFLLEQLDATLDREKALRLRDYEQHVRDDADAMAKEIITTAIQRCAAENTADTPETITVSSFDPVRREIARVTIEKLISDGRIHPARIEEMYEKAKKEVNAAIKQAGERAVLDAGVSGLNGELVKLLGSLKYAKKYRESEAVVHAIAAHHGDIEPRTIVACLVQAADAISASRPGARRENVQNYIKRLEKLEEIAKSFPGVDKSYAIQAGREVRIVVKPEVISDDRMVILARDIVKRIEDEMEYPGQIKVNVIRESRATDYAK